jgi:lipopolysaccharide export system permease protein
MLFDTTVRRELSRTFAATLVVILTIVLTMFLIRTIGQAAIGAVAPQDVVLLLGFISLAQLPTMLALSLFVGIVVTLGRMYRDSEMAIWFASGVGLSRFVQPVLRTSWPVLLIVGLLVIFVWPWGNRMSAELRDRYEQRSDLSRVAPGVFQSSRDGSRVFFIERERDEALNARNIFILTNKGAREAVTSAQSGRIEVQDGERYVVLDRGQRSEVDAERDTRTQAMFESYRLLTSERAVREAQSRPPKATRTMDLVREPTPPNQGELTWRLGLLFGAVNLLLLGMGLAAANPRRASNWNLLFALLGFVVYYNLINLTQTWVATGRVGMGTSLVGLHGGAFAFALGLLWWRDHAATFALRRRAR